MNLRFRKPLRIIVRFLLIAAAVLGLASLALWLFRAETLTFLAKRSLVDFGFEDPQLAVSSLTLESLTVESIQLQRPEATLSLKKLELTFSLAELLREKKLRSATLTQAHAEIPLPAASDSGEDLPLTLNSIEDLLKQIDLSAYLPLPFESIQILDSNISISDQARAVNLHLDASLQAITPETLALQASISRAGETLELHAQVSTPEHSSIEARLGLASPIASLEQFLPDWKKELPDLKSLSAGPLDLRLSIAPRGSAPPELSFTFELKDLALEYEEITARIPSLSGSSVLRSFDDIPLQLSLTPERLARDTLETTPYEAIDLSATLLDFSVAKIRTQLPIHWNYDSGFAKGKSGLDLSYDLSQSDQPISGLVISDNLSIDGTEILPVTLSISGSTDRLEFQSSQLGLPDFPQASVERGQGSILIPESDEEPIVLHFQSLARLEPPSPEHSLPAFSLELRTQVFDASTQTKITLASLPAAALAKIPGFGEIQGRLGLDIILTQDSATERFSGEASLDASDISIQGDLVTGNGIALQSKVSFQDLDPAAVDSENPLSESSLNYLLDHTSTTLDWQANQLNAQSIEAQWSGGSIAISRRDSQIQADTSFGAGILAYDALRLDQIYLATEYRGTLSSLAGTSTLSALLDGAPVEVSSTHQIQNLLASLSASGEYTLSPLSFTHSDLPARFAPELAGVSFSGTVQASGTFLADSTTADASLSASVSQGAIAYPASQLTANGLEARFHLDSLNSLSSGDTRSTVSLSSIDAGDAQATDAHLQFRVLEGKTLAIDTAGITFFGGRAMLEKIEIPIDGSDFNGELSLNKISLGDLAHYIELFDGSMEGRVSGYLPFRMRKGAFELLRGALALPDGTPATLRYETKGLLTKEEPALPHAKPTFSERVLKFLKVNPDLAAEQALGNITITDFQAELFPEDSPDTPIRLRIAGIAHSELADIPVVITTQVHGSLSELYNFLIRLNSL